MTNPLRLNKTKSAKFTWSASVGEYKKKMAESSIIEMYIYRHFNEFICGNIQIGEQREKYNSSYVVKVDTVLPVKDMDSVLLNVKSAIDRHYRKVFFQINSDKRDPYRKIPKLSKRVVVSHFLISERNSHMSAEALAATIGQAMITSLKAGKRRCRISAFASQVMKAGGASGVIIRAKGRLRGKPIARKESVRLDRVPRNTIYKDVTDHVYNAKTSSGMIGIKVSFAKAKRKPFNQRSTNR